MIAVNKEVVQYMEGGRKYYGFVSEEIKGDEVEMVFETEPSLNGLARWYLMFGDCARVIEPIFFKEKIQELAAKISANLLR